MQQANKYARLVRVAKLCACEAEDILLLCSSGVIPVFTLLPVIEYQQQVNALAWFLDEIDYMGIVSWLRANKDNPELLNIQRTRSNTYLHPEAIAHIERQSAEDIHAAAAAIDGLFTVCPTELTKLAQHKAPIDEYLLFSTDPSRFPCIAYSVYTSKGGFGYKSEIPQLTIDSLLISKAHIETIKQLLSGQLNIPSGGPEVTDGIKFIKWMANKVTGNIKGQKKERVRYELHRLTRALVLADKDLKGKVENATGLKKALEQKFYKQAVPPCYVVPSEKTLRGYLEKGKLKGEARGKK